MFSQNALHLYNSFFFWSAGIGIDWNSSRKCLLPRWPMQDIWVIHKRLRVDATALALLAFFKMLLASISPFLWYWCFERLRYRPTYALRFSMSVASLATGLMPPPQILIARHRATDFHWWRRLLFSPASLARLISITRDRCCLSLALPIIRASTLSFISLLAFSYFHIDSIFLLNLISTLCQIMKRSSTDIYEIKIWFQRVKLNIALSALLLPFPARPCHYFDFADALPSILCFISRRFFHAKRFSKNNFATAELIFWLRFCCMSCCEYRRHDWMRIFRNTYFIDFISAYALNISHADFDFFFDFRQYTWWHFDNWWDDDTSRRYDWDIIRCISFDYSLISY